MKKTKIFDVSDKNIIVTGSSSGIGLAIATSLIAEGAMVTGIDRVRSHLEHKCFKSVIGDLADPKCLSELSNVLDSALDPYDGLVNCAGVTCGGESLSYTPEDWHKTLSVNLTSVFQMCQIVGRHMVNRNKTGSIVNVTSIGGVQGFPNNPGYGASKGGLQSLTRCLAYDLGPHGIRVNNLVPGYTNTPMNSMSWNDAEKRLQREKSTMIGRWAEVTDLVGPAIFLISEASAYMTGSDLVVDGGWLNKGL